MSSNEEQPASPAVQPRPIRFGIRDAFAAVLLFCIHLTVLSRLHQQHLSSDSDTEHVIAAALIGAVMAFGAAYLSLRYSTTHKIDDFAMRIVLLVVFDVMLAASPLALFVMIVLWPLTLCFLFAWLMMRMNPARKKWAEQEEQRPRT